MSNSFKVLIFLKEKEVIFATNLCSIKVVLLLCSQEVSNKYSSKKGRENRDKKSYIVSNKANKREN